MASRRIRRHAMGVSNASGHDEDASISRSTVSLIHADRLVKVPTRERPTEPAARETRVEDRPTVYKAHDKLFRTFREPYVHAVLRSYCPDGSGLLSPEQLHAALERLHVGLQPQERARLIARVAPAQQAQQQQQQGQQQGQQGQGQKIHYLDFLRSLEIPQPLGGEAVALARGSSIPGPPTVRPGAGGHGSGDVTLTAEGGGGGGKSYWNWQRHPAPRGVPGILSEVREGGGGGAEQAQSDAVLTALLVRRAGCGRPDKLRAVFRRMDADFDSRISREEFAKGIALLGLDVPRCQVDRLFEQSDVDGDGLLDYCEFVARFEEQGGRAAAGGLAGGKAGGKTSKTRLRSLDAPSSTSTSSYDPLQQSTQQPQQPTLCLRPDEVEGALREPVVYELARSLYGRGPKAATAVFRRYDGTRSGQLGLEQLTRGCQDLVPGITERHVAALVASLEPGPAPAPPATSSLATTQLATASPPDPALTLTSTSTRATATATATDYRAFVGSLLESGLAQHPRHGQPPALGVTHGSPQPPRLLRSAPSPGEAGSALTRTTVGPEDTSLPPGRCLSAVNCSRTRAPRAAAASTSSAAAPAASAATAPPALTSVSQDRTALYRLHEVAITPFLEALQRSAAAAADGTGGDASTSPAFGSSGGGGGGGGGGLLPLVSTRSVDLGTLGRAESQLQRLEDSSGVRQQGGQQQPARRGRREAAVGVRASSGRAPAHATGRFGRFWQQRYADTTTVTAAPPASSAATPAEGMFVRKEGGGGGADYLRFQQEDREHEARRRQQLVQRYRARAEADARYSAADDASGADQGRLEVARAAKQRYEERSEMYDRIRQTSATEGISLFARPPAFHEHKLEGANTPTRFYW